MTSSDLWDAETAEHYDESSAFMFAPDVLEPAVRFLADLAGDGPALEFAIGTGRVAIPLVERGVPVSGIELSQPMVDQLHGSGPTSRSWSATWRPARCPGSSRSSISCGTASETFGPRPSRSPASATRRDTSRRVDDSSSSCGFPASGASRPVRQQCPSTSGEHHVGFDTYDMTTQQGTSHHYRRHSDGTVTYGASNFRYIWPAECDLMAQLAGMELECRVADWNGNPFTDDSESHVSVWRKPD